MFAVIADELDAQGFVRGCPLNNLAHELALADPDFRAAMERIFARWRDIIAEKARSDRDEDSNRPGCVCGARGCYLFRRHVDGKDRSGCKSVAAVCEEISGGMIQIADLVNLPATLLIVTDRLAAGIQADAGTSRRDTVRLF